MDFDDDWLRFWHAPWESARPEWLDDDWGRRWLARLADHPQAVALAYPDWCERWGWRRTLPRDADPLWRAYCLADATTLAAAAQKIGAALLPDPVPATLGADELEALRWGRRYRLIRPLPPPAADWPRAPAALGLGALRQSVGADDAALWPRLALRLPRTEIERLPDTPAAPDCDATTLRRLCRAALTAAPAADAV